MASIAHFATLPSTNRYCELLDLARVEEFFAVWADEQTDGIGQQGNHWCSEAGCNLTFSLVLHPLFMRAEDQFRLTQALSLAIADCLQKFLPAIADIKIKWPNDIYVGLRKICGTLLSTRIEKGVLSSAVCGIGLNVNQTAFPDWVPNPTSMKMVSGRDFDVEAVLRSLIDAIVLRYSVLRDADYDTLNNQYLGMMLFRGVPSKYLYHDRVIDATIEGVDRFGRLCLVDASGHGLCCMLKEIKYIV